jgi:sulfur-oxidizing protein SoxA
MRAKLLGLGGAAMLAGAMGLSADLALSDPVEGYQSVKPPEGSPFEELISGYWFRSDETRAMQDDEFENPGLLMVERGAELWNEVDGAAGKSCASCHSDAAETMKGIATDYPKWHERLGKPLNLEQRINLCRTENMQADAWKLEAEPLVAMTTFVRHQSLGMPVKVQIDGPMTPFFEQGKQLYYQRRGQLDMACAGCHEANTGKFLRSDHLSQGQTNGFPTYRLKWQGVGSLHRRFVGCMEDVRAEPYAAGSDEFVALELYTAWRGTGLPIETPSVRQ